MPLDLFLKLIEQIRLLLHSRDEAARTQRAQITEALEAVKRASNHTRTYLARRREDPVHRSVDTESALAEEWLKVGALLNKLDRPELQGLWERCFRKSEYWSDPALWTAAMESEFDINLQSLEETSKPLFRYFNVNFFNSSNEEERNMIGPSNHPRGISRTALP